VRLLLGDFPILFTHQEITFTATEFFQKTTQLTIQRTVTENREQMPKRNNHDRQQTLKETRTQSRKKDHTTKILAITTEVGIPTGVDTILPVEPFL